MLMKRELTVIPTKKQLLWGMIYLPVDMFLLPLLLSLGVILLGSYIPFSLSAGQFNGIYFAINFTVMILIFRKLLLQELRRLKGQLIAIFKAVGLGFLIYMVSNFYLSMLLMTLDPTFSNVNDAAIAKMASQDYWIILLGTVVLVPITEELLFRSVLFAGFYNRNRWAAYIVSLLIFSAVHVIGYIGEYSATTLLLCLLQYFPGSLCLCWVYAKADSVFAPVLLHTVINILGILSLR